MKLIVFNKDAHSGSENSDLFLNKFQMAECFRCTDWEHCFNLVTEFSKADDVLFVGHVLDTNIPKFKTIKTDHTIVAIVCSRAGRSSTPHFQNGNVAILEFRPKLGTDFNLITDEDWGIIVEELKSFDVAKDIANGKGPLKLAKFFGDESRILSALTILCWGYLMVHANSKTATQYVELCQATLGSNWHVGKDKVVATQKDLAQLWSTFQTERDIHEKVKRELNGWHPKKDWQPVLELLNVITSINEPTPDIVAAAYKQLTTSQK